MTARQTAALSTVSVAESSFGDGERAAVERVLACGILTRGPEVTALEIEFGHALAGGRMSVAVNSGTSALLLGLLAAGVGPGDEIIVPAYGPPAPVNAVVLCGATPVFADVSPGGATLSPSAVAAAIGPRTRGVLVVHLFGHPAPMEDLVVLAASHGLELFEDASHAPGALVASRQVGSWGTFAAFSLGSAMALSAGEGGVVTCRDRKLAAAVRRLRDRGGSGDHRVVGFSVAMTELSAAIARAKLVHVSEWNEARRMNAAFLGVQLTSVALPRINPQTQPAWHQYVVRVANRDRVANALRREWGVATASPYPVPVHRLPAFERFARGADLSETELASAHGLAIPVHEGLTITELGRVAEAVNAIA